MEQVDHLELFSFVRERKSEVGYDNVGKGMAGGKLVLTPPAAANLVSAVVGNTVLYGATGAEECFECGTLVAQL